MNTQNKLKLQSKNMYNHFINILLISILYSLLSGIGLSYTLSKLIEKDTSFIYIFVILSVVLLILSITTENIRFEMKRLYKTFLENEVINHLSLLKNPLSIDVGRCVAITRKLTELLAENFVNLIITMPLIFFTVVFSCIYGFLVSPTVLLISLVFVLTIIFFNQSQLKKLPELQNDLNTSVNSLMAVQWELIKNREVGAFLNTDNVVSGFNNMTKNSAGKLVKSNKYEVLPALFLNYGNIVVIIIVAVTGGILSINNKLTLAELFGLIILIPTISQSLFKIPKQISTSITFMGHLKTMDTIFGMDTRDDANCKNEIKNNVNTLSVKIEDFELNQNTILKDIDLEFESGKLCVIKGVSGCGKTTLLNIIAKLIHTEGMVNIDNVPLNSINTNNYWSNIAYVSQNPVLVDGDMNFNISLSETKDEKLIKDAIKFATIKGMLDTNSSGEIQKIAIARAFYKQPKIWLLDECTSSLDKESEMKVVENLKKLIKQNNSIAIVISHNEFVQSQADKLITLDGSD